MKVKMNIGDMRKPYNGRAKLLLETSLKSKNPFGLFEEWFKEIKDDSRFVEPNAMCLATATKSGVPSARFVLLKGFSDKGFKFFTHYTSRKGQELEENPNAALTFYWDHVSRSVRIEGTVEKLPFSDADDYFSKRPYQSQIGALCSNQSHPVENRQTLMDKAKELEDSYQEGEVPRPSQWGGYLLKPNVMEFWQGQTDRIHDRIRFRQAKSGEPDNKVSFAAENGWIYERLAP